MNRDSENWIQEEITVEFINSSGEWDTAYYYIWVDDETETNEQTK